ncbi:MAG: hypothetical protein WCW33_01045 [Candidatus Babeliales bacterium]|jgi:hypothetical protein
MKKFNLMLLCAGLCLACTPLVAMQTETVAPAQASSDEGLLAAKVYEQRAHEFLAKVIGEPASFLLEEAQYNLFSQFNKYLNERIKIASAILSNNISEEEKDGEERILDIDRVFYTALKYIDSEPAARFFYNFPLMVQENLTFVLRKKMSCRISDKIYNIEMEYAQALPQVTEEEFGKRFDQIPPNERERLLFIESKIFAQAILKILPDVQFHSGNYLVNSYNEVQAFDGKKS